MEKLNLNHGAELLLKPSKSGVSYFYVLFKGGANVETYLQQAHLVEHVVVGFDVKTNGVQYKNNFMGHYHADAKTGDNFIRFQFFVTNLPQLKEMLNNLSNNINNVIITADKLNKEKDVIVTECETYGFDKLDFSKNELTLSLKNVKNKDVKNYINNNLTANNLKIYAISNLSKNDLLVAFSNFVASLPFSETTNPDVDDDFQWNGKRTDEKFVPGLNYYDKDLNTPTEINLQENLTQLQTDILSVKDAILTVQLINNIACTDYKKLAKLCAFQLFIADYSNGIKKLLRHQKGLVYRTASDLLITPKQTAILTKIYLCKNEKETIAETVNWFKNIKNNGLNEQEFEVLKNNFEYSSLTRKNLKDDNFNFHFIKKDYINYIKSLSLEEYNQFLNEFLTFNKIKQRNNVNNTTI